jgi:hypothetical protein
MVYASKRESISQVISENNVTHFGPTCLTPISAARNIIWLADANYRIDLENEAVRYLASAGEFDALVAADQLKNAMDSNDVFVGYEEGPLLFPPTYRYDIGTDNYDTSEKMRIPAWTGE